MSNKRIRKKKAKRIFARRDALLRATLQWARWFYVVRPVEELKREWPQMPAFNAEDYDFSADLLWEKPR